MPTDTAMIGGVDEREGVVMLLEVKETIEAG
jgi:hypothetical protein